MRQSLKTLIRFYPLIITALTVAFGTLHALYAEYLEPDVFVRSVCAAIFGLVTMSAGIFGFLRGRQRAQTMLVAVLGLLGAVEAIATFESWKPSPANPWEAAAVIIFVIAGLVLIVVGILEFRVSRERFVYLVLVAVLSVLLVVIVYLIFPENDLASRSAYYVIMLLWSVYLTWSDFTRAAA